MEQTPFLLETPEAWETLAALEQHQLSLSLLEHRLVVSIHRQHRAVASVPARHLALPFRRHRLASSPPRLSEVFLADRLLETLAQPNHNRRLQVLSGPRPRQLKMPLRQFHLGFRPTLHRQHRLVNSRVLEPHYRPHFHRVHHLVLVLPHLLLPLGLQPRLKPLLLVHHPRQTRLPRPVSVVECSLIIMMT